jgi:alpha-N-arabinofuranosidase
MKRRDFLAMTLAASAVGTAPRSSRAAEGLVEVNPHVSEPRTTEVSLRGASARSSNVIVLATPDIHAHNDFENPHAVEPERKPANVTGASFVWTFKPASLS